METATDLLIECDLPVGRVGLIVHDELVLSGWATSPVGISGVAVQIGDRVWNASYGLDTPRLARRVGDFPNVTRAGYHLRIDTSEWTPGPHYVTVAAFDTEGGRRAIEGQVDVRPFERPDATDDGAAAPGGGGVTLTLDEPLDGDGVAELDGALSVSGWAHADGGIESVVVTLDHRIQHEALRPIVRPELLESHGAETAAEAGFALRLHESECPPGRHTLTVVALACHGGTAGVDRTVVCHPRTDPDATEDPPSVEWLEERTTPRPRAGARDMWQDRTLLAEADAAASRAQASLAMREQEAALRALRDAEQRRSQDGPEAEPPDALPLERQARYAWAARVGAARRVLDAGCGIGAGTAHLAAYAQEVVGIDVSPAAIEDARQEHGERATFVEGDMRSLPFEAGEFDLVVCFEALTHVAETDLVLDELRRVLCPGGMLLVSAPNRHAYPPGNPLQLAALSTVELERRLAARFANVATYEQQTYFASLLGTAATLAHDDPDVQVDADVAKLAGGPPGSELFAVAAATDGPLPAEPARIALGEQLDYEEQRRRLAESRERAVAAEAEAVALRQQLQR